MFNNDSLSDQIIKKALIFNASLSGIFNIEDLNQLDYLWSLGRQEILSSDETDPNVFVLKITQLTQPINQDLKVEVQNKNNFLQKAQGIVRVNITP